MLMFFIFYMGVSKDMERGVSEEKCRVKECDSAFACSRVISRPF